MIDDTTHVCSTLHVGGTPTARSRAPCLGCVYAAAVPDSPGQCTRAAPFPDGPAAGLRDPERARYHACLPYPGHRQFAGPIPSAQAYPPGTRCRTLKGAATRAAPRLWPTAPHLDPALSRRGLLGTRSDPGPSQHRHGPPGPQTVRRELAPGQALDHQPRSPVCLKQQPRDRLIRLAAQHADWALGCLDETWWSRVAQPALHSWTAGEPLRLIEQTLPKGERDPNALAG